MGERVRLGRQIGRNGNLWYRFTQTSCSLEYSNAGRTCCPTTGHRDRGRTEDESRRGKARHRAGEARLRRSQIAGQDTRSDAVAIHAMVPLMNMFGYADPLRQNSDERATFTMQFDHYAEAPPNISSPDDPPFGPAVGMRA